MPLLVLTATSGIILVGGVETRWCSTFYALETNVPTLLVKKARQDVSKWDRNLDEVGFEIDSAENTIREGYRLLEEEERVRRAFGGRLPNEVVENIFYRSREPRRR